MGPKQDASPLSQGQLKDKDEEEADLKAATAVRGIPSSPPHSIEEEVKVQRGQGLAQGPPGADAEWGFWPFAQDC